jgi:hypothetical protein
VSQRKGVGVECRRWLSGIQISGMTLALLLVGFGCLARPDDRNQITRSTAGVRVGETLWSSDHESGDLRAWYAPSSEPTDDFGGGEYNSGNADSVPSQEQAHSGRWSIKMTITTPPESGTRLFRWRESRAHSRLRYSVWFYFPRAYSAPTYWDVFQWKSKTATKNDPFFILNVTNPAEGVMAFGLFDWQRRIGYSQSARLIPVGEWFQVEAVYVCAGERTGHVTFWQDGTLLFDVADVQTRYPDGDCGWSVNNYSDLVEPTPATIYIDDASISLMP